MIEVFIDQNETKVVDRSTQKTTLYIDAEIELLKMIQISVPIPNSFERKVVELLSYSRTRIIYK